MILYLYIMIYSYHLFLLGLIIHFGNCCHHSSNNNSYIKNRSSKVLINNLSIPSNTIRKTSSLRFELHNLHENDFYHNKYNKYNKKHEKNYYITKYLELYPIMF